jgi:guanine deaminase
MNNSSLTALRGTIVSFTGDPFLMDPAKSFVHEPDGLIVCRGGVIEAVGPYGSVRASLPSNVPVTDYSGCILTAGFIDTHVHYVQTEMIASPGKQLLAGATTTSIRRRKPSPTKATRALSRACSAMS